MTHTFIKTMSLAIAFAAVLIVPTLSTHTDTPDANHHHAAVVSEL